MKAPAAPGSSAIIGEPCDRKIGGRAGLFMRAITAPGGRSWVRDACMQRSTGPPGHRRPRHGGTPHPGPGTRGMSRHRAWSRCPQHVPTLRPVQVPPPCPDAAPAGATRVSSALMNDLSSAPRGAPSVWRLAAAAARARFPGRRTAPAGGGGDAGGGGAQRGRFLRRPDQRRPRPRRAPVAGRRRDRLLGPADPAGIRRQGARARPDPGHQRRLSEHGPGGGGPGRRPRAWSASRRSAPTTRCAAPSPSPAPPDTPERTVAGAPDAGTAWVDPALAGSARPAHRRHACCSATAA